MDFSNFGYSYSAEDCTYNKPLFKFTLIYPLIQTVWFWCLFQNASFFDTWGESHADHFSWHKCCFLWWCVEGRLTHGRANQSLPSATLHLKARSLVLCAAVISSSTFFHFLCLLSSFCFIQLASYHLFRSPISLPPCSFSPTMHHRTLCVMLMSVSRCGGCEQRVLFWNSTVRSCRSLLAQGQVHLNLQWSFCSLYLLPRIITQRTNTAVWHSQSHCHFLSPNQSSICHITSPSCFSFKADKYMFINSVYVQH